MYTRIDESTTMKMLNNIRVVRDRSRLSNGESEDGTNISVDRVDGALLSKSSAVRNIFINRPQVFIGLVLHRQNKDSRLIHFTCTHAIS